MDNKCFVKGLSHLFVVYIIWGSTYLAMRITVRPGSGFDPFAVGWTRLFCASIILFIIAKISKRFVIPKPKEFLKIALTGLLMWVSGHGLILWSEKYVASAYAALFVGSLPIWTLLIEAVFDKKIPKILLFVSVILGFTGLVVLTFPNLKTAGFSDNYWSIVALLCGTLSWAIGTFLQKRFDFKIPTLSLSAYQQLIAAFGFFVVSVALGEKMPNPSHDAVIAWLFLMFFGSVIAFSSFVKAVSLLPNSLVMTFAYVNPVIALILGYIFLDEKITIWTLIGAGLIVVSVIGILANPKLKSQVPCNSEF